jgi:futalosine hydrolase
MDQAVTAEAEAILVGAALVRGATVSVCSGTDSSAASLARRTGAQIETMEGAAVALVCAQQGLPMIQLRCVSNLAGDRERGGWDIPHAVSGIGSGVAQLLMEWQP